MDGRRDDLELRILVVDDEPLMRQGFRHMNWCYCDQALEVLRMLGGLFPDAEKICLLHLRGQ